MSHNHQITESDASTPVVPEQAMRQMIAANVAAACGTKGKHDPDRAAVRHGSEAGPGEVSVGSYEVFNDTEVMGRMAMERMLAGLSTRHYPAGLEPVGASVEHDARSTSKSAVQRRLAALTGHALADPQKYLRDIHLAPHSSGRTNAGVERTAPPRPADGGVRCSTRVYLPSGLSPSVVEFHHINRSPQPRTNDHR